MESAVRMPRQSGTSTASEPFAIGASEQHERRNELGRLRCWERNWRTISAGVAEDSETVGRVLLYEIRRCHYPARPP